MNAEGNRHLRYEELLAMGYRVQPLGECAAKVTHSGGKEFFVFCGAAPFERDKRVTARLGL